MWICVSKWARGQERVYERAKRTPETVDEDDEMDGGHAEVGIRMFRREKLVDPNGLGLA